MNFEVRYDAEVHKLSQNMVNWLDMHALLLYCYGILFTY